MSPAQNPCTPHHAITLHHRIILLHYTTALRHRITPSHYVTALHHCVITHEAPKAPPTPLGDVTSLYRSTTGSYDTLGRHYCPKTFPNRAVRYPWATLKPRNVPQQFCAAPSDNALPLFRRWRVRIEAVLNKPGDTFSTLGRRFKPTSFPNRAARHSRATFQPLNVPHQCCAAPSGNTSPLFRRRNVRIDPVMNMLGDTFGTPWATIQAHIATPIEPHCTFGRHYYVPERVVDDGATGCNCSPKKG